MLTAFIRKFFSLLVSYIVFPKPLTWSHFAGLVFVFSSVGAHAWQKLKKKSQNSPHLQPADMRKVNELERIENGVAEPVAPAKETAAKKTPAKRKAIKE